MPKKPKGPKWTDIRPDPTTGVLPNSIEWREGFVQRRFAQMGKSRVWLRCPFCKGTVEAYVWSLCGGGKRCDCGALAGGDLNFYHFAERSA